MNFYQFHIGDYAAHTRHLTPMEDIAFRRLLDLCYLSEKPLPSDVEKCARLIGMNDRSTDVEQVLNEFFSLGSNGWENKRASEDIAAYQAKKKQASDAGKASAAARKPLQDKDPERTGNDRSTDVEPTKNQEPLTKNQEKDKTLPAVAGAKPVSIRKAQEMALLKNIPDLDTQIASDWLQVRHAKKTPLTATALAMVESQAKKAGLTTSQAIAFATGKGWAGFSAKWYENEIGTGEQKTHAERTQDFKNQQAEKFYAPLLSMTDEEKREWGFA